MGHSNQATEHWGIGGSCASMRRTDQRGPGLLYHESGLRYRHPGLEPRNGTSDNVCSPCRSRGPSGVEEEDFGASTSGLKSVPSRAAAACARVIVLSPQASGPDKTGAGLPVSLWKQAVILPRPRTVSKGSVPYVPHRSRGEESGVV